jgi:hypothetical protein
MGVMVEPDAAEEAVVDMEIAVGSPAGGIDPATPSRPADQAY